MIITDDLPPSPVPKSPTGRTAITSPSSRAATSPETPYQPLIPPPTYADTVARKMGEPAERRFAKAFICAVGIYAFFLFFISSVTIDADINYRWGPAPEPEAADGAPISCHLPFQHMQSTGKEALPWIGDGIFINNTDSTEVLDQGGVFGLTTPPYWSRTDFSLPADAPLHFFFSRGSLASGGIKFVLGAPDDEDDEDLVKGIVITRYWSIQARDRANLCTLKKEEGSYGFGIYTPLGWPVKREDMLSFDIVVTIPRRRKDLAEVFGALHTDFTLFAHDIGALADGLYLHDVDLSTSNLPVRVGSLRAQAVTIRTSNAAVSGSFDITDTIDIQTSNGFIDTHIVATNKDWHKPTDVNLKTTNAYLQSEITLQASEATEAWHRPADTGVKVKASTSNARLSLSLPKAPLDSHIQVDGSTSNGASHLELPPAFEGKLTLKTSGYSSAVVLNDETPDPTGQGRRRTFNKDRNARGVVEGRVWWGPEKDHRELGYATMRTSNSQNVVRLT